MLGLEEPEDDDEAAVRRRTGLLLVGEALQEQTAIRKILQAAFKATE